MTENQTDSNDGEDRAHETPTFLRKRGVQIRMQCNPQVAYRIEDTFVTVENMVEAMECSDDLTEYHGIGPKTAQTIEDWWEVRFEREDKARSSTVEPTGRKSATIHIHHSWSDAIGGDDD